MLAPKDRRKLDAYSESHFFFPLKELPRWLVAAQLHAGDVEVMSLLNTIQSEDVSLRGEKLHFKGVSSPLLLAEVNRPAMEILRSIPRSMAVPEELGGAKVLGFASPPGGPSHERWYWAAPAPHTLAVGGRAAVEEVLAIAAGRGDGITGRRVLRPILKDLEHSQMVELDLIPPTREATMGILQGIGHFLEAIPGISMLFSIRGQAVALEQLPDGGCIQKLDYQFSDRVPAFAVWAFFRLTGPKDWSSAKRPEEVPEELLVRREAGLVMVHMRYGASRCRATEGTGKRVRLFEP